MHGFSNRFALECREILRLLVWRSVGLRDLSLESGYKR